MSNDNSFTFLFLRKLGLHFSQEEYGKITFWFAFKKTSKKIRNNFLMKYCSNLVILTPFNSRIVRPKLLKWMGCKIGKNVFIGDNVYIDKNYPELIEIGDNTYITGGTTLLCHKRDISDYHIGDNLFDKPYKTGKIVIGKGCSTGTNTLILPGVTIGDGAIIGAGSLVTRDIPAWTLALGRPAVVVRQFTNR